MYYKTYSGSQATDLVVFEKFKIADDANTRDGWTGVNTTSTKVTITAYAVQKDGFNTAKDAWDATYGKPVTPVV